MVVKLWRWKFSTVLVKCLYRWVSLFACGEYIVLGTFSTGGEEIFVLCIYGLVVKLCTREWLQKNWFIYQSRQFVFLWRNIVFSRETNSGLSSYALFCQPLGHICISRKCAYGNDILDREHFVILFFVSIDRVGVM